MANNGPNTNGCQFFLIYSAQPHLNNMYTIFGQVNYYFIMFSYDHALNSFLLENQRKSKFPSNPLSVEDSHTRMCDYQYIFLLSLI